MLDDNFSEDMHYNPMLSGRRRVPLSDAVAWRDDRSAFLFRESDFVELILDPTATQ